MTWRRVSIGIKIKKRSPIHTIRLCPLELLVATLNLYLLDRWKHVSITRQTEGANILVQALCCTSMCYITTHTAWSWPSLTSSSKLRVTRLAKVLPCLFCSKKCELVPVSELNSINGPAENIILGIQHQRKRFLIAYKFFELDICFSSLSVTVAFNLILFIVDYFPFHLANVNRGSSKSELLISVQSLTNVKFKTASVFSVGLV